MVMVVGEEKGRTKPLGSFCGKKRQWPLGSSSPFFARATYWDGYGRWSYLWSLKKRESFARAISTTDAFFSLLSMHLHGLVVKGLGE